MSWWLKRFSGHVSNHRRGEFGTFHFRRPFHLTGKVVSDDLLINGFFQRFDDHIRRFLPAQMFQHHDARQDHRTRIDFIQIGVFGRRSVGRLKNGVAGYVVNITAGSNSDTTHLGGQGVRQIVAVQVECSDHIKILGTG